MLKALIDGDVLVYQASFVGQKVLDTGELQVYPFEKVMDFLDTTIEAILDASWADENPLLFLTWDEGLMRRYQKESKREGYDSDSSFDASKGIIPLLEKREVFPTEEFLPNFRFDAAKTVPYKSNRNSGKPFHYNNTRAYLLHKYDCVIIPGVEADDAMAMYQTEAYKEFGLKVPKPGDAPTVICSRDKDLMMVPGYHYGWSSGLQDEMPLVYVDRLGWLKEPTKNSLKGGGLKFFFAQMIMGDRVDAIPGLKGKGPAYAYKVLGDNDDNPFQIVRRLYEECGESEEYFREQASLLWMVDKVCSDGTLLDFMHNEMPYKIGKPITFWRKDVQE